MLVQALGASAFGLRGGIPMEIEAAQMNVYHAPASRADTTRPIRIPTTHLLAKKRGPPMPPSEARECTPDVQRVGNRGQLCETKKRWRSSRYASHTQGPLPRFRSDFVAVRGRRFYPGRAL